MIGPVVMPSTNAQVNKELRKPENDKKHIVETQASVATSFSVCAVPEGTSIALHHQILTALVISTKQNQQAINTLNVVGRHRNRDGTYQIWP